MDRVGLLCIRWEPRSTHSRGYLSWTWDLGKFLAGCCLLTDLNLSLSFSHGLPSQQLMSTCLLSLSSEITNAITWWRCELSQAIELCNNTGNKAACYFLGLQFARAGRADDAVHFFTQAGVYGSAIRVCKVGCCCVTSGLGDYRWLFHAGPGVVGIGQIRFQACRRKMRPILAFDSYVCSVS